MKPFTFYDIYYTPLKELDDKLTGKFFRMICDFLDGKQVTIDAESDAEISPEFELYWERRSGNVPQIGRQKLRAGQAVQTCSKTKCRQRQTAMPSDILTSANVSWTRANSGCKTVRRAADRKRIKIRRKRAVYPKSAIRLHGKRTEINHKPTTEKAPCKGERDT